MFDTAWKSFRRNFKPILDSLKRHRALLLDERITAAVMEIQAHRQDSASQVDGLAQKSSKQFDAIIQKLDQNYEALSDQIYAIQALSAAEGQSHRIRIAMAEKLRVSDFEADHRIATEQRFSQSGDWIGESPDFMDWLQSPKKYQRTLYIHGIPGSGEQC
jgi:hypothetical protein